MITHPIVKYKDLLRTKHYKCENTYQGEVWDKVSHDKALFKSIQCPLYYICYPFNHNNNSLPYNLNPKKMFLSNHRPINKVIKLKTYPL